MIDTLFLVAGLLTTFLIARRDIPSRTCFLLFGLVGIGSLGFYLVSYFTGFPFGELMAPSRFNEPILSSCHWSLPLWWIILLTHAYIITSVILVQGQKELVQESIFLIVLLTGMITALVHATWEPIAVNVRQYWFWLSRDMSYYGTPRLNLVGWYVVSVFFCFLLTRMIDPSVWRVSTAWRSLTLLGLTELILGFWSWKAQFFIPVFIALNLTGILAGALLISEAYWKKFNGPSNHERSMPKDQ
jgi:uncharacterized membrane protein